MEKVTLIVAIYKSENFLRKLIDTIINQTWTNLEIILVDDGSPDKSGDICDEYAKRDCRIVVIHKKNGGTCSARNEGLKIATGDYIAIIDGDDWLENDFVEYLMNLVHTTDSEMAMTDRIFTTRDRIQTRKDYIETWSAEDATAAILYPKMEVGPWNKIYKTSLLKDNNIFFSRPWSGEGSYFASMAAQYANHVGIGHKKIYNYRLNNINSGLSNYNVQMGINALDNINYIYENLHIKTRKIINAARHHIWKNHGYLVFLIVATNSQEENKEKLKKNIRYIRKHMPIVLLCSDCNIKAKISIILNGLFPIIMAKRAIKKRKRALISDKMT